MDGPPAHPPRHASIPQRSRIKSLVEKWTVSVDRFHPGMGFVVGLALASPYERWFHRYRSICTGQHGSHSSRRKTDITYRPRAAPGLALSPFMFRVLTPASPPPFIVYRLGNLNHRQDTRALTHSLTHSPTHSHLTHSRPQTHTSRGAGSEAHESSRTIPLSVVNCSYFRQCSS